MSTDDAFYQWGGKEPITADNLTKRPMDLHLRVKVLEANGEAVADIQREVNDTVLAQTEQVLAGLRAQLAQIVQLDWLTGTSATPITLVAGQERGLILPADEWALFAPGPWSVVQRISEPATYAVVRTINFDRTLGQFDFTVVTVAGAAGPFADWSISAVAGSTLAQMVLLAQGQALQAAIDADAAAAHADRLAADADVAATGADRTATHADRLAADASATAAGTSATNAAKSAGDAAATAASIAGGPVASINNKPGIVALGVADVPGAAPLASPAFTGAPTAPTAAAGDATLKVANTAFVAAALAALVNSSPAALDTLKELADALGDDPNFATTVTTALANRLRVDVAQALTAAQQSQARSNIGAISRAHAVAASYGDPLAFL